MARFDNKVVPVSGGARGQGAAEARLLVAQGAKVVSAAGHDQVGSDRPRRPQNPGELGSSGPIDTDMIAFRTPEQREERMKQAPMHRHGTPEEVAQLGAFLLSDESSYITGAEIAIDGASSA